MDSKDIKKSDFPIEDDEDELVDSLKTLDKHNMEEVVASVIQLSDGRIAVVNEDGLLKIFSIIENKFNLEAKEELKNGSFLLEMRNNILVTHCFRNEYIIKIEGKNIKQIPVCESIFNVTVYKIEKISDNLIAQCSNSKTIELIEFKELQNDEYQCTKKYFQIFDDGSNDLEVNGLCLHPNAEVLTLYYQKEFNRLISGSSDKILRVWDVKALNNCEKKEDMINIKPLYEVEKIEVCIGNTISCYKDMIFTGGIGYINILKNDNYEIVKSVNLDELCKIQIDIFSLETFEEFGGFDEVVVVGTKQGALMIFDTEELMLLGTEPIHQGMINNICKIKDKGIVVTGAEDGLIKLFKCS